VLETRRYNFQPVYTPTLSATMYSVTDGQTDRQTDRRQYHASSRIIQCEQ